MGNALPPIRITTAELAELSGCPATTVAFLVREGLLTPSVARGAGRGSAHAWNLADLVAATALTRVQRGVATAKVLRPLLDYFTSGRGLKLIETALHQKGQLLLLMSDSGVIEQTNDIAKFMEKTNSTVVHVVDAKHLIEDTLLAATEMTMIGRSKKPRQQPKRRRKTKKRKG
jgi:hypothetical protein